MRMLYILFAFLHAACMISSAMAYRPHADRSMAEKSEGNTSRFSVHWMGPFFSGSGYGSEAASYMLGLAAHAEMRPMQSPPLSLKATHYGDAWRETARASYKPADLKSLEKMMVNAQHESPVTPSIIVCHSMAQMWMSEPSGDTAICPPDPRVEAFVYLVGRTMWEAEEIPDSFLPRLHAMNEIWLPSAWNKETFIRAGIPERKIRVLKQGVDVTWLDPRSHRPADLSGKGTMLFGGGGNRSTVPFRFMSAFKWEARKGWDVLLTAYLQEFSADDDVELFIMTKPFAPTGELSLDLFIQKWVVENLSPGSGIFNVSQLPAVRIITDRITDEAWPTFYRATNAFVLPSRGEGWGRPLVEAMSMAVPCIATNSSGITAYLDETVGYPLRFEIKRVEDSGDDFKGLPMAFASTSHTRDVMRHVLEHRGEAEDKGRLARERMVKEYSLEAVSVVLLGEIRRIEGLIP